MRRQLTRITDPDNPSRRANGNGGAPVCGGNGEAHNMESLSRITRIPVDVPSEAMPRLESIGWMEVIEDGNGNATKCAEIATATPQGEFLAPYRKEGRKERNRADHAWKTFKETDPAHRFDEEPALRVRSPSRHARITWGLNQTG